VVTKVTEKDVPTEITRSDVDTVVRSLLNNNAYTISDVIEGEDKFGGFCAEVKSWVIDLELPMGIQGASVIAA
jgi:hypothetical protein